PHRRKGNADGLRRQRHELVGARGESRKKDRDRHDATEAHRPGEYVQAPGRGNQLARGRAFNRCRTRETRRAAARTSYAAPALPAAATRSREPPNATTSRPLPTRNVFRVGLGYELDLADERGRARCR